MTTSSQASTMSTMSTIGTGSQGSAEFSSFMDFVRSPSPSGDVESGVAVTAEQTAANGDNGRTTRPKLCTRRSSTTEERRNPFAVREGNNLVWKNISMTLRTKKTGHVKLLDEVWGEVPKGKICAIMGPSGAGKTSLLNILSGRARSNSKLAIDSDIRMNNFQVDPTDIQVRKQIAFVAQEDSLSFTATPREAIRFSAKLRLPRITTDEEIEDLTEKMLAELGLTGCADTMIGGDLIKGISGGERKRTSVGVELVVKPSLVFLDEPTSGLDSYSAAQVVKVLKKIARAGSSVLFTIHQPSSEVFTLFDHLILLNRGQVMYNGPTEDVGSFFGQRNYPLPKNFNPADWIMQVAQQQTQEQLTKDGFFTPDERKLQPAALPVESELLDSLGVTARGDISNDEWKKRGFLTEVSLLFRREIVHNSRNKRGVGARFALTIFLSTLVGCIFYQVGNSNYGPEEGYDNLPSHFGAMIMILIQSMFGTAMPTLLSFPEERPVFLREYSTNHYSVLPYFMSRLCMEAFITLLQILVLLLITFFLVGLQSNFFHFLAIEYGLAMSSTAVAVMLGCAVEDPKMATEFLPLLYVPQLLFAGFFVRTDLMPVWLRWAQYLCALTYGARLALLSEFGDCAAASEINPCRKLLMANQVEEDEQPVYWAILWLLFVTFRLCGLALLRKKATKFY